MTPADMEQRLARFIATELGVDTVTVSGLRRLAGGASREIWALDLAYADGGQTVTKRLVLRRDPHGAGVGTAGSQEFRLLRAAHAHGVPVPRVYWCSDDRAILDAPFFLMDRIDGETIPRKLLRDPEFAAARAGMTTQFGRILAAIHAIDRIAHGLDFLTEPGPDESPAQNELDRFEQIYRAIKHFGNWGREGGGVSGIEIALWDLVGKVYGVPCYQFLGGKYRDRVRVYADTPPPAVAPPDGIVAPVVGVVVHVRASPGRRERSRNERHGAIRLVVGCSLRFARAGPGRGCFQPEPALRRRRGLVRGPHPAGHRACRDQRIS